MKKNMEENFKIEPEETRVRYIATILIGDEYHKEGEEHEIGWWANTVENVKERGLRLHVKDNIHGDGIFHYYPVSIRKEVYTMKLSEVTVFKGGGDKIESKTWEGDHSLDWMEHW